jgi:hypothetical protein
MPDLSTDPVHNPRENPMTSNENVINSGARGSLIKTPPLPAALMDVEPEARAYAIEAVEADRQQLGDPVKLIHMAVIDEGELRMMSGREPVDCELYAMPDFGRAPVLYAAPARDVSDATIEKLAKQYDCHASMGFKGFARALLARYGAEQPAASAEPVVRYCPGCGSVGPVEPQYRDCCPDGNQTRMIPQALAEKCRDTFKVAIREMLAEQTANDAASVAAQPSAPAPIDLQGLADKLLTPIEITRDEDGYFSHPADPILDESIDVRNFLSAFGLECDIAWMESQVEENHPAWIAYQKGEGCAGWNPSFRDGWALISIHETEDGPVALYVRAAPAQQGDPRC